MKSNNDIILSLDRIHMRFRKKKGLFGPQTDAGAVVDFSLDIRRQEIVALVGESGCGKTTLGKIMSGIVKPTGGRLIYNGVDVSRMNRQQAADFRDQVQIVHQDSYAALNPVRTIYQSLSGPLLHKKIVKTDVEAHERVCELLKTVELHPPQQFMDKYPHQLSGGQRQRILMARAISLNPKLIVADEPVSMIDVSLRIAVLNLMSKLNREMGIAFVYITHDLATARYIAKQGRVATMYLGQLIELGEVEAVLAKPRHPYLQALLTAVPIPDPKIAKRHRPLPLKSLDMPSITEPPSGCRFHPRCLYATDKCEQEPVSLVAVGSLGGDQRTLDMSARQDMSGGHEQRAGHNQSYVACHHHESVPPWQVLA